MWDPKPVPAFFFFFAHVSHKLNLPDVKEQIVKIFKNAKIKGFLFICPQE